MKASTITLTAVACLVCGVAADDVSLYAPVADTGVNRTNPQHILPTTNVSILYGPKKVASTEEPWNSTVWNSTAWNNTSLGGANLTDPSWEDDHSSGGVVNVQLSMNYPTVLLENIAFIESIDCEEDSVTVTFNSSSAFETTLTAWSAEGDFIMITNHLGNCDAEVERGFFLTTNLNWNAQALTVTATAVQSNISHAAGEADVSFGGIPATVNGLERRRLKKDSKKKNHTNGWRDDWLPTWSSSLDLDLADNKTLLNISDSVLVIANDVSFDTTVSYSGYIKYNFWEFKVKNLTFDFELKSDLTIDLTAEVIIAYSKIFKFAPGVLTANIIDVPGILTIGPGLNFIAEAELDADAPVNITIETKAGFDGKIHLDLLHESQCNSSGWTPQYYAEADVTASLNGTFSPSASLGVGMEVKFVSGLIDLSSGVTVAPRFTNSFVVQIHEQETIQGNVSRTTGPVLKHTALTGDDECPNGMELISKFYVDTYAWITKHFKFPLYTYQKDIVNECWSWDS